MSEPALAAELRRHDRDRYQTALFAPPDRRASLFALYSFNYEIGRIREAVSEPLLGRIRLQWWRDAIDEIYAGAPPRRHAVIEALAGAITAHRLAQAHFTALFDARAADMEDAAIDSLAALTSYAAGTAGSLIRLALEILGVRGALSATAADSIGIAYALSGLLMAAPFHARARRLYLPQDLLVRHAVDLERGFFALKSSPGLAATGRELVAHARRHLAQARQQRTQMPRAATPALLHGVIAERRLQRLEAAEYNLFDPRLTAEDTLQALRLGWAALRGRY